MSHASSSSYSAFPDKKAGERGINIVVINGACFLFCFMLLRAIYSFVILVHSALDASVQDILHSVHLQIS